MAEQPRIETERLLLRLATQDDVETILGYVRQNRTHLAPFEPDHPEAYYTEGFWRSRVEQDREDHEQDVSCRLWMFLREQPDHAIASVNFTGFVRGIAQLCTLGYSIAAEHEGRGYMTEGVGPAIGYVFEHLNLHRIIAGYMPHNRRSGDLLRRLGFVVEGYSRDFLLIHGHWEDHIQTALVNPRWRPV